MCCSPHQLIFRLKFNWETETLDLFIRCKVERGSFQTTSIMLEPFKDFQLFLFHLRFYSIWRLFLNCGFSDYKRFIQSIVYLKFTKILKLIMFIELCQINKLVMHLNSYSMDLGRDKLVAWYWLVSYLVVSQKA